MMLVTVEIDLTKDKELMAQCHQDPTIMTMLLIHEATDSESDLERIGKAIWKKSRFVETLVEFCGDELYSFKQDSALLFSFQTTDEAACLFSLGCHNLAAINIITPKKVGIDILFSDDA